MFRDNAFPPNTIAAHKLPYGVFYCTLAGMQVTKEEIMNYIFENIIVPVLEAYCSNLDTQEIAETLIATKTFETLAKVQLTMQQINPIAHVKTLLRNVNYYGVI